MKKLFTILSFIILFGGSSWADVLCDVNGDGKVGMPEAVYALQVAAKIKTNSGVVCDVNNDDEIGLFEAVNALQISTGINKSFITTWNTAKTGDGTSAAIIYKVFGVGYEL